MATSIQVSVNLLNELRQRKLSPRETYEDVIMDLVEDSMQLNAETRRDIEKARSEIKAGRFYKLEDVRKELRL